MKSLKIPKISECFDIIIISLVAFYPELFKYIWYVFHSTGFGIRTSNLHIIIWVLLCFCFYKQFTDRLPKIYYGIYIAICAVFSVFCIFPWYYAFSWTRYFDYILKVLPYFMLGRVYRYDKNQKDILYILSVVTFCLSFIYIYFFEIADGEMLHDSMFAAYNVLPSILILWTSFFEKKKVVYKIFAVLGVLYLFLLGTRGPIVCVGIFVILMVIKHYHSVKIIAISCMVVFALGIYMSSVSYGNLISSVADGAEKAGFSTRIFNFVQEDDILNDTGRSRISNRVIEKIKESPFEIRGPYSDWVIIGKNYSVTQKQAAQKGVYVHNFFLELWTHYGVIFGSIVALFVIFSVFKLYKKVGKDNAFIACMLICIGFVVLMVSSSYLLKAPFYFLLGICYNKYFFTEEPEDVEQVVVEELPER